MKIIIMGLLGLMICAPHSFASLSEIERVHSDVHAQIRGTGAAAGKVADSPIQREQGH